MVEVANEIATPTATKVAVFQMMGGILPGRPGLRVASGVPDFERPPSFGLAECMEASVPAAWAIGTNRLDILADGMRDCRAMPLTGKASWQIRLVALGITTNIGSYTVRETTSDLAFRTPLSIPNPAVRIATDVRIVKWLALVDATSKCLCERADCYRLTESKVDAITAQI